MLTISSKLLRDLAKALREEPSLRPHTQVLAEQLTIFVLKLDQEARGEGPQESGEWR